MRVGLFRRPVMCDPPSAAAISVLAGKLAGVDGRVNSRELAGFHELFSVPAGQRDRLGRLMERNGSSPEDFRSEVVRFGQLHRNRPRVVAWALERLQELALVDGPIHPSEAEFLQQAAQLWHLPRPVHGSAAAEAGRVQMHGAGGRR